MQRGMNPKMMKQFQQLQARIMQAQKALEEAVVEASAGGGAVTVRMSAKPSLDSISIQPEAVDPDEVEMLQDLIQAAVNEALERVRAMQMEQMSGLASGLNIPGLP